MTVAQPMDTGAERKVSGREAVCAHVATAGGAVAAVPVELADGGGSYRYLSNTCTGVHTSSPQSHDRPAARFADTCGDIIAMTVSGLREGPAECGRSPVAHDSSC